MNNIRREKGFLQIDETNYKRKRFCTVKSDGFNSYDWIYIYGEKYLFKQGTKKEAIFEVFWSHVLNALEISNVQYDLAFHDNFYGVITKNYNQKGFPVKSIYQIIEEYEQKLILETGKKKSLMNEVGVWPLEHLFNIQELNKIYYYLYHDYGEDCVEQLRRNTVLKFIIQMLLGDRDCHPTNTEIWFNQSPKISPFYDFGNYGKVKLIFSINDFQFKYLYERESEFEKPDRVFLTFIRYANVQEMEMLKEYMNRIMDINRKILFEELEEKFHHHLSYFLKCHLSNLLLRNTKSAERILKRF